MEKQPRFFRPHDPDEFAQRQDRIRASLELTFELLKAEQPDTFLGRRHHDPIPLPSEDE